MSGRAGPPTLWTRVLRFLLPRGDRDHVIDELTRLYATRVRYHGHAVADRWYRREVWSFMSTMPWRSTRPVSRRPDVTIRERIVGGCARDVKVAGRSLVRNPGFAVVAVVTLTLGIGANTVIFSIVDHIAFRALPYHEPARLVQIWPGTGMLRGELYLMQRESRTLSAVAGYVVADGFNLYTGEESRRVQGSLVSPELLSVLGVRALVGRNFSAQEATPANDAVVMLAHGYWREQYGADPEVIGRSIDLDGAFPNDRRRLAAGFWFPSSRSGSVCSARHGPRGSRSVLGLGWAPSRRTPGHRGYAATGARRVGCVVGQNA